MNQQRRLATAAGWLIGGTLALAIAPTAAVRAQLEVPPPVERSLADLAKLAAEERTLIDGFKRNIAEKKAIDADDETLSGDTAQYKKDLAAAQKDCTGAYDRPEYARRKALCDQKEAEFDERQAKLTARQGALTARRAAQRADADRLAIAANSLRTRDKEIEERLAGIPSFAPISAECRGQEGIAARWDCLDGRWANTATSAAVAEQNEFEHSYAHWLASKQLQVRAANAGDTQWRHDVLVAIQQAAEPAPNARPAQFGDLAPGDVVLLAPEGGLAPTRLIPASDWLYRSAGHLASGESFGAGLESAARTREAPVSHAITVVKSVNGHLLFLDHTKEGSRILTMADVERKYGGRDAFVARPETVVDGRTLWTAAREAALKRKSDFGMFGDKVVCSERMGIAVAKATGLPLDNKRIGPIDITPGDFFDEEGIGKYFLVSPIGTTPAH